MSIFVLLTIKSIYYWIRPKSIGKDEDKEEPFFIHRSEWSKWKADKRNGILYNYRVRFFLLSQVLSSLADLSLRDRRCSLPYCGCAL